MKNTLKGNFKITQTGMDLNESEKLIFTYE